MGYVGRFAPSPTGPLHFGSLIAALGSFLQARSRGGHWLLRIEDLDPPREPAGAAEAMLRALEAFGLHWDGAVIRQSRRQEAYAEALERLRAQALVYRCDCSRSRLQRGAEAVATLAPSSGGQVYPGTCRRRTDQREPTAWRLRVGASGDDAPIEFADAVQGPQRQDLAREVGDFVLRRRDGPYAYQLAVVVDDAWQGVSEVVRGADLLDNTPRQILLQRLLGTATPDYAHLPVATHLGGQKLSKQSHAPALDERRPLPALIAAWRFLGQPAPPPDLGSPGEFLAWATARWSLRRVPRFAARPAPVA